MKKSLLIVVLSFAGAVAFGQNAQTQVTLKQGLTKPDFENKKVEQKLKMRLATGALKAQEDSNKNAAQKPSQELKAVETKDK